MKRNIGPHKRRGMIRRRMKALIIVLVILLLIVVSSLTTWDKPEPKKEPSASELAYMRNVAALSPGDAAIYVEQWPEYADYIIGK